MAASFIVEVVTPESVLFQGPATSLKLRTSDGELMILAAHTAYVTDVVPTVVKLTSAEGTSFVAVDGGYLQVATNDEGETRATLLAGLAEVAATEVAAQELLTAMTSAPVEA